MLVPCYKAAFSEVKKFILKIRIFLWLDSQCGACEQKGFPLQASSHITNLTPFPFPGFTFILMFSMSPKYYLCVMLDVFQNKIRICMVLLVFLRIKWLCISIEVVRVLLDCTLGSRSHGRGRGEADVWSVLFSLWL